MAGLEGRGPLIRDEDVVQVGRRDAEEADEAGSQRIEDTGITMIDLPAVRERGVERPLGTPSSISVGPSSTDSGSTSTATSGRRHHAGGRLPPARGLNWDELTTVLRMARESGQVLGMEVTIFNPTLDLDGSITRALVTALVHALGGDA